MLKQTDFPAYSIALYGRGKVEECCLRLQDEYGLDVNAVLFCYWFGTHHGVIGEDLWTRIEETSSQWQSRLIQPLREARRWLKDPNFESDQDLQDLRERIKENEIAAELLQQRMMQKTCADFAAGASEEPAAAAQRNAEALLRRRGIDLDDQVNQLLAAISRAAFD